MAGRKSKLTPEVTEKLCTALKAGNTRRAACGYAGISEDSFANYLRQSSDFSEAIRKAESDAEVHCVAVIRKAMQEGLWGPAAWWLERRRWQDWKKRDEINVRNLPTDQLLALVVECESRIESAGDRAALTESE